MNPHNMQYTFGDDLREEPQDIIEFKKGIDYLLQKLLQEENVFEQANLLSSIGVHQRIARNLEASLKHLLEARNLLEDSEHIRLYLVNEIRLGQTFQFLAQFTKAETTYQLIENYIAKHPEHKNLLHFVYQHKGKNYFAQQQYQSAETFVRKALDLRKALNNAELIQSSEFSLKVILIKKNNS